MAKNILIINPFGVGDVLFSTPLVSAIKEAFPESYIAYICNIRTKEILETNPCVNELFVFERDEYRALWKASKIESIRKFFNFWREIQRRKFDLAIDLSLGKEYAFLCWLVGIKERRGFNYKGRGRFLTYKVTFDGFNDRPVAEYYLGPMSLEAKSRTTLIPAETDEAYIDSFLRTEGVAEKDFLMGIAPGGGISFGKKDQERRRWPAERFSQLADLIVEKFDAKVILIWGSGEKDLIEKIAGLMRHKPLIAPETTIREMAALCKRCRIVICSEGGPLHIASSQGVKTISIFGPVDEKVYGPYPPDDSNIVITSDIECRPCYKRFKLPECSSKKCIEDISIDRVFNAVSNLMEAS